MVLCVCKHAKQCDDWWVNIRLRLFPSAVQRLLLCTITPVENTILLQGISKQTMYLFVHDGAFVCARACMRAWGSGTERDRDKQSKRAKEPRC